MSHLCRVCHTDDTSPLMDFGVQPNSMHLLSCIDEPHTMHPLVLWECKTCGFVFIADPMPPDAFYVDVQHATMTSPPEHLEALLNEIVDTYLFDGGILDIGANTGYLLAQLRDLGFANLHGIEPSETRFAAQEMGLEVEGGYFTLTWAKAFIEKFGYPQLVVCRHVLEHVQDLQDFMAGISALLSRGGTLLLEVPDLNATTERGDFSVIWEQHVNYFDLPVLRRLFCQHSLSITDTRRIEFGGGTLLCFAQHNNSVSNQACSPENEQSPVSRTSLATNLSAHIAQLHNLITTLKAQGGKISGFGAGERGAMTINLSAIGGMLDYVVDDNPQKVERFLSGTRLPIKPSTQLDAHPPDFCILFPMNGKSVEERIMKRFSHYVRQGGTFIELFPCSGDAFAMHGPAGHR